MGNFPSLPLFLNALKITFQVQLRLQQVVGAAPEKREDLLKELEQFAFRGIPNLSSPRIPEQHQVPAQAQSDCKEAQGDICETKEDKVRILSDYLVCILTQTLCTVGNRRNGRHFGIAKEATN